MPPSATLQVLIFRHLEDEETQALQDAIVRGLQGGRETGGYLGTGDDLGIQLEVFNRAPPRSVATMTGDFLHTLCVVLVDHALLDKGDEDLWDWLDAYWTVANVPKASNDILVIAMDERAGRRFAKKRNALGTMQLLQFTSLGESAIRPSALALRIIHQCRVLVAGGLTPDQNAHLRIFISHAKLDSLPLAQALKHQIESLGWLQKFYDVDDLPPGRDWRIELERGVESSLVVMLRTEIYEERFWCQQEVLWADEYATPAVLVDARINLNHPSAALPFDRIPTVRIPDGNLFRILFVALREGLRFLNFKARINLMAQSGSLPTPVELRVFSFHPSMAALLRACHSLAASTKLASTQCLIVYPDPPLRTGMYEAANALVAEYGPPGTRLVTPNTIAAAGGATP